MKKIFTSALALLLAFGSITAVRAEETAEETTEETEETVEGISQFILRMYEVTLGREPDEAGFEHWYTLLSGGISSGSQVAQRFLLSTEMNNRSLSDEEFVTIAYQTMLGREPDEEGLAHWCGILAAGATRNYIIAGFSGSEEFGGICSDYGIYAGTVELTSWRDVNLSVTAFAVRLYEVALSRKFDEDGLEHWCGQLLSGTATGAEAAERFLLSAEMESRGLTDEEFVRTAYMTLLNREADEGGLQHWLDVLYTGVSRKYVIVGFARAPEFSSLCEQYGITAGSVTLDAYRDRNLNVTQFVNRMYLVALSRMYDTEGMENWCRKLIEGTISGAQTVQKFLLSAEMENRNLTDEEFVRTAYLTILDREADTAGLAHWMALLKDGISKSYVLSRMTASREFALLCGDYGITAGRIELTDYRDLHPSLCRYLANMFRASYDREFTDEELDTILADFENGRTALSVITDFLNSDEMAERGLTDGDLIRTIYQMMLQRDPTDSEIENWQLRLDAGLNCRVIAAGLSAEDEFIGLCSDYGIEVGYINTEETFGKGTEVTDEDGSTYYVFFDENGEIVRQSFRMDGYYYTVDSQTGELLMSQKLYEDTDYWQGIDISQHNGAINLEKYEGQFVIIRIAWGTNTDSMAVRNMNLCEQLGIPYGVYIYSYAINEKGALSESSYVLNLLKGRNPQLGVWYDMEDADGYKLKHGAMNNTLISKMCQIFCREISNAGYPVGIYASYSWFENIITGCDQYYKWVAHWGVNDGNWNKDLSGYAVMHQFTSTPLDRDLFYINPMITPLE